MSPEQKTQRLGSNVYGNNKSDYPELTVRSRSQPNYMDDNDFSEQPTEGNYYYQGNNDVYSYYQGNGSQQSYTQNYRTHDNNQDGRHRNNSRNSTNQSSFGRGGRYWDDGWYRHQPLDENVTACLKTIFGEGRYARLVAEASGNHAEDVNISVYIKELLKIIYQKYNDIGELLESNENLKDENNQLREYVRQLRLQMDQYQNVQSQQQQISQPKARERPQTWPDTNTQRKTRIEQYQAKIEEIQDAISTCVDQTSLDLEDIEPIYVSSNQEIDDAQSSDENNSTDDVSGHSKPTIQSPANTGSMVLNIPEDKEVIEPWEFSGYDVQIVSIPQSVKVIQEYAFNGIQNLKQVVFEEGSQLEKIEKYAFAKTGLEAFNAPPRLQSIGNGVFSSCKDLKTVKLNNGFTYLGDFEQPSRRNIGVFERSGLREITLPPTLKYIGHNAFASCKGLTYIELPSSVTQFGYSCFRNSCIQSITIPQGITCIKGCMFTSCKRLKEIKFAKNSQLQVIESKAFRKSGLLTFVAPPRLQQICNQAFGECGQLTSVILNEGLQILGDPIPLQPLKKKPSNGAFYKSAIHDIQLPSTLEILGPLTFNGCANLVKIQLPSRLRQIGYGCFQGSGLLHVTVPESVTAIEYNTFYCCKSLRTVFFAGQALKTIEAQAFVNTALQSINVPSQAHVQFDSFDKNVRIIKMQAE